MESQDKVQAAAGAADGSGVLHVTLLRGRPFCGWGEAGRAGGTSGGELGRVCTPTWREVCCGQAAGEQVQSSGGNRGHRHGGLQCTRQGAHLEVPHSEDAAIQRLPGGRGAFHL